MGAARIVWFGFFAILLVSLFAIPRVALGDEQDTLADIKDLKKDISTLNLLNGLHLTNEQQAALLEEARNAEALRKRYRERNSFLAYQAEERFRELKTQLMDPSAPPDKEVQDRARKANNDFRECHEAFIREMARIEKRAAGILTAGQIRIIEDFSPCLIPPKNLRDPSRAGQANDTSGIERQLSRARKIPESTYEERIDRFLEKHIEKLEKFSGPMTDEEIAGEKDRILSVVAEARAMSDVEFELNKQELAARIDPKAAKKRQPATGKRTGKVSRFLLTERIIPILEQRVAAASVPRFPAAAKLGSITPAEDCRVQCSIK